MTLSLEKWDEKQHLKLDLQHSGSKRAKASRREQNKSLKSKTRIKDSCYIHVHVLYSIACSTIESS